MKAETKAWLKEYKFWIFGAVVVAAVAYNYFKDSVPVSS